MVVVLKFVDSRFVKEKLDKKFGKHLPTKSFVWELPLTKRGFCDHGLFVRLVIVAFFLIFLCVQLYVNTGFQIFRGLIYRLKQSWETQNHSQELWDKKKLIF